MTLDQLPDDLRTDTQRQWHRFVDATAPLRPELHRYCRRLTGNIWDAEDLVQDTMLRAFSTLGVVHQPVLCPRAYLVRIATNLWTDRVRRRAKEAELLAEVGRETGTTHTPADAGEVRDAATVLLSALSPQERAAVTMKDVLDMSLNGIAAILATTPNAIKAALHRGRARLQDAREAPPAAPTSNPALASLIDRYIDRLSAADFNGLLALMLPTGTVSEVGTLTEVGREQWEREGSFLWQSIHVHPELPPESRPPRFLHDRVEFLGEPVMIGYVEQDGRKILTAVTRFDIEDGRVRRLTAYLFCPETVREIGEALGMKAARLPYWLPTRV